MTEETLSSNSPVNRSIKTSSSNFPVDMSIFVSMAKNISFIRKDIFNIFGLVRKQTEFGKRKSNTFFSRTNERVKTSPTPTTSSKISENVGGSSGGLLSIVGGAIKGIVSGAGSIFSGLAGVAGGIIGGIGSFLGGAARGIFSIIGGALSGAGLIGLLAAAGIGYVLYQLYENLDFSSLKKKLNLDENFSLFPDFDSLKERITKTLDKFTDGGFSETMSTIKNTFIDMALKTVAVIQTGMQLMTNVFTAAVKDAQGFTENVYKENKGAILAAIAAYGSLSVLGTGAIKSPKGLAILAAIPAVAGAYGAATGEKSLEELKSELEVSKSKLAEDEALAKRLRDEINNPPAGAPPEYKKSRQRALTSQEQNVIPKTKEEIDKIKKQIEVKESRTGNLQKFVNEVANPEDLYQENLKKLREQYQITPPAPAPAPAPASTLTPVSAPAPADPRGRGIRADMPAPVPSGQARSYNEVLGFGESANNYNTVGLWPRQKFELNGKPVVENTLEEIAQYQDEQRKLGTNAQGAGKYAFMTVREFAKLAGLSMNEKFSPGNQDKMQAALTNANRTSLKNFLGREPEAWELAAAHSVGAGGFQDIINAQRTGRGAVNTYDILAERQPIFKDEKGSARTTNPHLNLPASQVFSKLQDKFRGVSSPFSEAGQTAMSQGAPNTGNLNPPVSTAGQSGQRVSDATTSFTDVLRRAAQAALPPVVVNAPTNNNIQGGGFKQQQAYNQPTVVDTEFMKLLVGRTVNLQ